MIFAIGLAGPPKVQRAKKRVKAIKENKATRLQKTAAKCRAERGLRVSSVRNGQTVSDHRENLPEMQPGIIYIDPKYNTKDSIAEDVINTHALDEDPPDYEDCERRKYALFNQTTGLWDVYGRSDSGETVVYLYTTPYIE